MFPPKYLAYAIGVWGCGAICGPILGPLLGGFTYQANGWRWPLWCVKLEALRARTDQPQGIDMAFWRLLGRHFTVLPRDKWKECE